jgi:hypothetical protein
MSMDMDMIRGFERLLRHTASGVERGLALAGSRILQDSILEIPAVPLEEGTLKGSGSVHVNGKFVEKSASVGGNPTPNTDQIMSEIKLRDTMSALVGFNTPYAAYQHEEERQDGTHKVTNYTHSGSGGKFLEKKLFGNASRYLEIVARTLRRELGNG